MTQQSIAVVHLGIGKENGIESTSIKGSKLDVHISERDKLSSSLQSIPPSTLDSIEIIVDADLIETHFDPLALASLVTTLRKNSLIEVKVKSSSVKPPNLEIVNTAFLLAGLNPESEQRDENGTRTLAARKGVLYSSAARISNSSISEDKKTNEPNQNQTVIRMNKKVMIDDLDDDDGLIDEDGLLDFGDGGVLAPPPMKERVRQSDDDCGGRKPCDDCTCGRAERELGLEAKDTKQAPTSACGKCGLGDAFRCASCPYLGKPAFKPGKEHLVLNLNDDIDI
mmetsp:Transcript_36269/g.44353  ORF Transcript_36269/g.44353 Transcript_36269/m.44353 type:complete len:282 (+) Transcript_36269:64-909(+)|eukprot:CAMPEP_0172502744 /NCGR_PEP_ID=MMETSP1066-20121228/162514_1 /TAXON_ID=671091 /ORGANISM="Coscinodiscus wailesii, Strain CCMP2513" /LENGTH=281 /DNA_ID=CAMNT_0013278113 /DNA_START=43 /DNA_END=888 /DNA_ORIENTATION=-